MAGLSGQEVSQKSQAVLHLKTVHLPPGGLGEGPRLLNQRRMKSYRVCVEGGGDGGEMAQKSRALTGLPEDVGSVPSTHEAAAASPSRSRGSGTLWHVCVHAGEM